MRELPSGADASIARVIRPACVLAVCAWLAAAEQAAADPVRIEPGQLVTLQIEGPSETHSFSMSVSAGEYLHVVAVQESVDVTLTVQVPGGESVETDLVDVPQGPDEVSAVAASAGDVRIEVRSKARAAQAGAVTLRTEAGRAPTPADRARIQMEAALRKGLALRREGRAASFQQAIKEYENAGRLAAGIGDVLAASLAALGAGDARTAVGDYGDAIALLEEALAGWRSLRQPALEGKTLHSEGTARFYLGEVEAALDLYLAALPIRRASGDRWGEVRTLGNIGAMYGALGQLSKALESIERVLAAMRATGSTEGQSSAMHNLAVTHHLMGHLQQALDILNEALPLAARDKGEPYMRPAILSSIASVYTSLGDVDEALRYQGQSLAAWREVGHPSGEATTLDSIGASRLELGEIEAASDAYQQALGLYRGIHQPAASTLLGLAEVERRGGHLARAQELAEEGLKDAEAFGSAKLRGDAYRMLGRIRDDAGDLAGALEHQTRALSLARGMGEREGEARSLEELGRIHVRQGELDQARASLEEALALVAAVRVDLQGVDLRTSFAGKTGRLNEAYVDALVRLHERDPRGGWLARAFEASERGRAQTMVETLAASRVGVPAGVAPELVERARGLQQQLTARLDRQLRLVTGPHSEEQAGAQRTAVDALRGELRAAQADLAAAGPRYAALRQPPVLSAVDTQRLLDADTVALEYALGEERSVLFVVGASSLEAHRLPSRATIESAVDAARKALAHPAATRSALEQLSGMLLGPASGAIEGKRLVVVPDGPLQAVPFAALPSPTRPREALVERHQVTAVPSASLVALLRAEAVHRPSPTRSVVVFADPVFDPDDERVASRSGSRAPLPRNLTRAIEDAGMGSGLGRLPFTRREATAIVRLARDGKARLDFEASRQNVTSADLTRYRFVHFATHGFLNSSHPDLSGLVLSLYDRQGAPRDGFLSAGDVLNLDLSADLVVLSGCRTALGREVRGEGVVGLARAFMYAGTSRVLASLWKVDDAATAELMGRLYQGLLRDGLAPAEALQKAQKAMAAHKRWSHPYYWAGFQLQGDWN